ncbi:MAG TPA: hypothetical protein VGB00_01985 [Pyrinomonadaceae bacterium]|jgi:hypothetical protein
MKKIISFSLLLMFLSAVGVSAQSEIMPIMEMNVNGLLGGVKDGKFVDAKTTFEHVKGKKSYSVYSTTDRTATLEIDISAPGEPCEDFYRANPDLDYIEGVAVGTNPGWNLMPRAARWMAPDNATYIKAASDALRTKGIINKAPKIRGLYRVDLEGDGQEEILISATSYEGDIQPRAKKGDYSFVLLRKIVGGKVRNIIVAGDFVTKKIDFGAPSEYRISSILDLNGDGKMEIILYGSYYEGRWIEVYEMKANKPANIKALNAGCGV